MFLPFLFRASLFLLIILGFEHVSLANGSKSPVDTSPSSVYKTPESMAALGDSMSAGVLAPFSRKSAWSPIHHLGILLNTVEFLASSNRESFAFRQYSWATGEEISSHATRLKRFHPGLLVGNFSKPSAYTGDLLGQIDEMMDWSMKKTWKVIPDYVTLLIGHNDLCADDMSGVLSVAGFSTKIRDSLGLLLRKSRGNERILVMPLSRIDKIVELSAKARLFPLPKMGSCEAMWKVAPLCPTLTQTHSPKERKALSQRLREFNRVLSNEVSRARSVYGDRVRIAEKIAKQEPHPDLLAIDCFHPNIKAQKILSEDSWAYTWWAK